MTTQIQLYLTPCDYVSDAGSYLSGTRWMVKEGEKLWKTFPKTQEAKARDYIEQMFTCDEGGYEIIGRA